MQKGCNNSYKSVLHFVVGFMVLLWSYARSVLQNGGLVTKQRLILRTIYIYLYSILLFRIKG